MAFEVHCARGINGHTKAATTETRDAAQDWIDHFESRHIGCEGPHWIEEITPLGRRLSPRARARLVREEGL